LARTSGYDRVNGGRLENHSSRNLSYIHICDDSRKYYFRLWAKLARETIDVGYPHMVPFYTPPHSGNVWDCDVEYPSDQDLEIAERIGRAVVILHQDIPLFAKILREFYAAYPGAPSKSERLKRLKMPTNRARELKREAERWCEVYVNFGVRDA
jgi:hypothetical protein